MMGCGPWTGSSSILPPVFYPAGGVVGNGQGRGEFSQRASPRVMEVKLPSPTPNCCHLCVIQKVPNTLSNILECILVFKIATSFYYFLRITFECVCISVVCADTCVYLSCCQRTTLAIRPCELSISGSETVLSLAWHSPCRLHWLTG